MWDRKAYMKEYLKTYRDKPENKVKAKSYADSYYQTNSDVLILRQRQYRKDNRVKINKRERQYKKDHPEIKLRSDKKHYAKYGLTKWDLRGWTKVIRKGNNCSYCDSDNVLHSHHIFPKSKYKDLALNENNGVVLCDPCHREHHSLNGVN